MKHVHGFLLAVVLGLLGAWLSAPQVATAADANRLIMVPDVVRTGDVTYAAPIAGPAMPAAGASRCALA